MLDLVFSLYRYKDGSDPKFAGSLVWTFPPQSVAEQAVNAGFNNVLNTMSGDVIIKDSLGGDPYIDAYLSGASRLAFGIGQTTFARFRNLFSDLEMVSNPAPTLSDLFKDCLNDDTVKILSPGVVNSRTSDPDQAQRREWLSSIEFPAGLFLSCYENARWRSSAQNPDEPAYVTGSPTRYYELWHLDLPEAVPQIGLQGLTDPRLNPNKPQGRLIAFSSLADPPSIQNDPKRPFPLDAGSRLLLAAQMRRGWGDIESRQFQLSSIGASCDVLYLCDRQPATDPPVTTAPATEAAPPILNKWEHRSQLGRDNYCEVVLAGFLLPFLIPASYIRITSRTMSQGGAVLIQRQYIQIKNPTQQFFGHQTDPGFDHLTQLGRGIPFKQVVSNMPGMIEIADPIVGRYDAAHYPDQYIFFPYHYDEDNQPRPLTFLFHSLDCSDNTHQLSGPMLFCTNLSLGTGFYKRQLEFEHGTEGLTERLTDIAITGPPLCIAPAASPFELVPESIAEVDVITALTGAPPNYPRPPGAAANDNPKKAQAPIDLARMATTILSGVEVRINDTFGEFSRAIQRYLTIQSTSTQSSTGSSLAEAAKDSLKTFAGQVALADSDLNEIITYVGCLGRYHIDFGDVPGLVTQIANRVGAQFNQPTQMAAYAETLFDYSTVILDQISAIDGTIDITDANSSLTAAKRAYVTYANATSGNVQTDKIDALDMANSLNESLKRALISAQTSIHWNEIRAALVLPSNSNPNAVPLLPEALAKIAGANEWLTYGIAPLIEKIRGDLLGTLGPAGSLTRGLNGIINLLHSVPNNSDLIAPIQNATIVFTDSVESTVIGTFGRFSDKINTICSLLLTSSTALDALKKLDQQISPWVRITASSYVTLNLRLDAFEERLHADSADLNEILALWKMFVDQLLTTCQRIVIENKDSASILMQLVALDLSDLGADYQHAVQALMGEIGNFEGSAHDWANNQIANARLFVSKLGAIDDTVRTKLQQWSRHILPSEVSDICTTLESIETNGRLGQDILNQLRDQFVALTRAAFANVDPAAGDTLLTYLSNAFEKIQASLEAAASPLPEVAQAIQAYADLVDPPSLGLTIRAATAYPSAAVLSKQWDAVTKALLLAANNPTTPGTFAQCMMDAFRPNFLNVATAETDFVEHLQMTLKRSWAGSLEDARSFLATFRDPAKAVEPVIRSAFTSFAANVVSFDNDISSKLGELKTGILDPQLQAYPKLFAAGLNIPSVNPTDYLPVEFHDSYLRQGISELTSVPGGLIAQFKDITQTASDAAQELGSSVINPSLQFQGLGRKIGAIAGQAAQDGVQGYLDQWKDSVSIAAQQAADAGASLLPDVTQMVPDAKLLGGVKLSDLLATVEDAQGSWKKLPQIALARLPNSIEKRWTWHGPIQPFKNGLVDFVFSGDRIFTINSRAAAIREGNTSRVETELHAEIERTSSPDDIDPPESDDFSDEEEADEGDASSALFNLVLGGVLQINFTKFTFTKNVDNSTKLDLELDMTRPVQLIGQLDFIEEARQELTALLEGIGIEIQLEDNALSAGWRIDIPAITSGAMVIEGLSFASLVRIPLKPSPLQYEFSLASQEQPFIVTVSGFGGGGYILVRIGSDGYKLVQGDIRFGAEVALSLGVAAGKLWLMGGIFFAFSSNDSTLTAFVDAGGSVLVFGIITISIDIRLGLSYQSTPDATLLFGQCQVRVSVKIGFFSKSASFAFSKTFVGSTKTPQPPPKRPDGRQTYFDQRRPILLASVGDAGLESAFEMLALEDVAPDESNPSTPASATNFPSSTFGRRFSTRCQWNNYWDSFHHLPLELN